MQNDFYLCKMQEDLENKNEDFEGDELFEHYRIKVDGGQQALRIDKFLMARLSNVSRNKVQEAIKNGFVKINETLVKANYKIKPGDDILIALPEPPRVTEVVPENIPLNIVYEDEHLLVVNKPAGMVVHPAYNNWSGTLVNALVYHFNTLPEMKGNEGRPGLVHRIDKDTSGLLVIAKTDKAMSGLAKQFFDHSIDRTYFALVWGIPEPAQGTVNVHLGRSLKDRKVTAAFPDASFGKHAITHYQTLKELRYVSWIQCKLETGRTHQIRAHMKYIGHPLFNDGTYGGDKILKGTSFSKYKSFVDNCFKIAPRQALHAGSLGFIHPVSKMKMYFEAPLPEDLEQLLLKWEHYVQYT